MNDQNSNQFTHEKIETNPFLMIVLILLVISIGGLVGDRALVFSKVHHPSR